jgi:hypothetical protein
MGAKMQYLLFPQFYVISQDLAHHAVSCVLETELSYLGYHCLMGTLLLSRID